MRERATRACQRPRPAEQTEEPNALEGLNHLVCFCRAGVRWKKPSANDLTMAGVRQAALELTVKRSLEPPPLADFAA